MNTCMYFTQVDHKDLQYWTKRAFCKKNEKYGTLSINLPFENQTGLVLCVIMSNQNFPR